MIRQGPAMPLPHRRGYYQFHHLLSQGFRASVAKGLFSRRIELDDLALMVHCDDAIQSGSENGAAESLVLPQRFVREFARLTLRSFSQRAPYDRAKPLEMIFQYVICRAGLERLHRPFFPDGPGN